MTAARILYTSFDQVPAPKGASAHILAFTKALGQHFGSSSGTFRAASDPFHQSSPHGNVVLVTPAPSDVPVCQIQSGVRHLQLGCAEDNPLGRARIFRQKLSQVLAAQPFDVIHFRSIFEGMVAIDPALRRGAKLVYEANGFPSIEMKYHYPGLLDHPRLIAKLQQQEARCLSAADQIITVSEVTRQYLQQRCPEPKLIDVIRNGFDDRVFTGRIALPCEPHSPIRVAYFGTSTAWQGLETLLDAVQLVNRRRTCLLSIATPANARQSARLKQRIQKLGLKGSVYLGTSSSQQQVASLLQQSHMTVVPLLDVDRNRVQGCCPIKLLEAMASGCPVIASDLPVVRELARANHDYLPCRPGDAQNLRNCILQLAEDRDLAVRLSQQARQTAAPWTWERAGKELVQLYDRLLA